MNKFVCIALLLWLLAVIYNRWRIVYQTGEREEWPVNGQRFWFGRSDWTVARGHRGDSGMRAQYVLLC
jgi:hypothetical protein